MKAFKNTAYAPPRLASRFDLFGLSMRNYIGDKEDMSLCNPLWVLHGDFNESLEGGCYLAELYPSPVISGMWLRLVGIDDDALGNVGMDTRCTYAILERRVAGTMSTETLFRVLL